MSSRPPWRFTRYDGDFSIEYELLYRGFPVARFYDVAMMGTEADASSIGLVLPSPLALTEKIVEFLNREESDGVCDNCGDRKEDCYCDGDGE